MFDARLLQSDLIRDEGLRLKPYIDTVGKVTIGIGRNLADNGISRDEALILYGNDVVAVARDLDRIAPWWRSLGEPRARALMNMAFNMGAPRLLEFRRFLAALQAGQWTAAGIEALDSKWARQVGDRAHRVARLIEEG